MVRKALALIVIVLGTALLGNALAPQISTSSPLPSGVDNVWYRKQLSATGGSGGYTWTKPWGTLPKGLSLGSGGVLSGTPTQTGSFSFTVRVTDSKNQSSTKSYSLRITAADIASGADNRYCAAPRTPQFGASDGPAKLPGQCINSAMSSTPSPGATYSVCSSGCAFTTLQAAVDAAACGDTVELAAGQTFASGKIIFPARHCDDGHWITVRTSTPDNLLPPEGTRMTPCWAGVASLPDRPKFDCPSTGVPSTSRLAKIVIAPSNGSIFIRGDHYRLIGLEVTRPVGGGVVSFFFNVGGGSNVVFDRMWMHGTPHDELTHGVMLSDSHHVAVIDSYLNDFKCIAKVGACSDSQTVSGNNNSIVGIAGAYKIVNNFLEAAGENILFGGGSSVDTGGDFEIRRNHLYKPMSWNPGSSTYAGTRWVVKNHLEMKNATRALVEGNVFENIWGGFSQFGAHVLLTPKNQAQGWKNLCSICQVTNITLRYNHFITGGQVFQIANGKNSNNAYAKAGGYYSIHDNLAENIAYRGCYGCTNQYNMIATGLDAPLANLLSNISMAHNTFVVGTAVENAPRLNAGFLGVGGPQNKVQPNISITNNIFAGGYYGPWSTGQTDNCAYNQGSPKAKFTACWSGWTFAGNVISNGMNIHQIPTWPTQTTNFPANQSAIGYVNLGTGLGGDYRLSSASGFRSESTDGTDPGADMTTLNSMTGNVR